MPAAERPWRAVVRSALLPGSGPQPYGGLDLREGDRDPGPGVVARYGGRERPDLTATTHVRDLQRDLRELGFLQAPENASAFDRRTRWAVQEFQRYAALAWAAVERLPEATVTSAPMSMTDRALRVETLTGFPDRPPFRLLVGDEIMEASARLDDTGLTVTRGVEDTAPVAHPAGAEVRLLRWSDRLTPVRVGYRERYSGRISGVVNARTRQALSRWKRARRRCPVVVEAWDMWQGRPDRIHVIPAADGRPARRADNVWDHDEVTATTPTFFVRDLTRAWRRPSRPPAVPGHPELDVAGGGPVHFGRYGPHALPEAGHTWRPEGELLPEHLLPARRRATGPTLRELTAADDAPARRALSTFKVIRAVAEAGAVGHFDAVRGGGRALLVLGPCRWAAGPAVQPPELPVPPRETWPVAEGDLWGLLSLLKATDRAAFTEAVGRFGLDVATDWGTDGRALFVPERGTYATRPAIPRESGPPRPLAPVTAEYDVFRGWHWFYRFQMAARTVDGFRRAMWRVSRLRLRHLLHAPWYGPAEQAEWTIDDPRQGTRPLRVGDVFTSERATALLLHWHVRRPADIVVPASDAGPLAVRAGAVLRAAVARTPLTGTPATWGDAEEAALISHLLDQAGHLYGPAHPLTAALRAVHDWPCWETNPRGYTLPIDLLPDASDGKNRKLSTARHSFLLDATALPPPPERPDRRALPR